MRPLRPLLATGAAAALAGALLVPPAQAAEIDGITPTITVDTESVDYWDRFEVGVTFGTVEPLRIGRVALPPIGFGYRAGENLSVFRLVIGQPF